MPFVLVVCVCAWFLFVLPTRVKFKDIVYRGFTKMEANSPTNTPTATVATTTSTASTTVVTSTPSPAASTSSKSHSQPASSCSASASASASATASAAATPPSQQLLATSLEVAKQEDLYNLSLASGLSEGQRSLSGAPSASSSPIMSPQGKIFGRNANGTSK
ncbi:hypothetical protein KR059_005983 [Drosophila kikkawai]|nr:hypothetical protein KR059_005983 [Drosophila kikkawai]